MLKNTAITIAITSVLLSGIFVTTASNKTGAVSPTARETPTPTPLPTQTPGPSPSPTLEPIPSPTMAPNDL